MKRTLLLVTLAGLLAACSDAAADKKNPVVVMETSMGTIKIELAADKAPITVKNFLSYVDDKFYDGTIFHRVMGTPGSDKDFMIQGGGLEPGLKEEKKTKDPIKNEADNGLSNKKYTIAMARKPDPESATAQFFINVADNDFLDHKDKTRSGYGYCVFGKVIEGMAVVDKIKMVDVHDVQVGDRDYQKVPVKDVIIKSVRRADK